MSVNPASLDRLHRIGVIGAGQMGGGIAHVCALAGFDVVVTDLNEETFASLTDEVKQRLLAHSGARCPRSRAASQNDGDHDNDRT